MSARDRRVTLALKYHYLDNQSPREIRDRFEEEGIGDYAVSTIRNYLNEAPADEVVEQIEEEHANVRLQAAERFERLYQTAREDHDELAVSNQPIKRVVPQMAYVDTEQEHPLVYPDWEFVDPGDEDWPDWASPDDVVIRFVDEQTEVLPGQPYPKRSVDGSPKYTTEIAGIERDALDLQARQSTRSEMAQHMRQKADVLGVYSTDINMTVDGEVDHSVELDSETAAAIREATLTDE